MTAAADAGFYSLPSGEQLGALRELALSALGAWDLGDVSSVDLLAERENAVFAVQTDGGSRFVLRVHRAGYHTDAELVSQVEWMRALQSDGVVNTADVVDALDGRPFTVVSHPLVPEERQVSLLVWVEGDQLSSVIDAAGSGDDLLAHFEVLGALMARLHLHAEAWQRPPGFSCPSWDGGGLLGEQAVWGRFWALDQLDEQGRSTMAGFREQAAGELDEIGTAPGRYNLIHNDFLPENILLPPGGGLTLLDFDDSGDGWFLFDIATALVGVSLHDDYPSIRDAFLAGYGRHRALPAGDLARLPLFFALRTATYAAWMETRAHTQFAKDLGAIMIEAAVDVAGQYVRGELSV